MTFDEVREILKSAAWTRETPLVTLFDELVERHDQPQKQKHYDGTDDEVPGRVTAAFAGLTQSSLSSGQVVARVLGLRRGCRLKIYEVGAGLTL